jgi:hypothetical protein
MEVNATPVDLGEIVRSAADRLDRFHARLQVNKRARGRNMVRFSAQEKVAELRGQ